MSEILILKRAVGQINWVVTQCRPDMAYQNCVLGNSMKSPTVNDACLINKAIRKLKRDTVSLSFHCGSIDGCTLVVFCDASFASLPNGGSQGAFIVFLIDTNGIYSPLTWQSHRIKRVVKSTIAAECLAAMEAAESAFLMKTLLLDIYGSDTSVNVVVYCDNRNLVDCIKSCTSIEDKRLLVDVSVLRDMVSHGEINDIKWVSTDKQLSNCMTKQGAPSYSLIHALNNKLKFDFDNAVFV